MTKTKSVVIQIAIYLSVALLTFFVTLKSGNDSGFPTLGKSDIETHLNGLFSPDQKQFEQAADKLYDAIPNQRDAILIINSLQWKMPRANKDDSPSRWRSIFYLIQNTESKAVREIFRHLGVKPLLSLYLRLDQKDRERCLKTLAMLATRQSLQKVVAELTKPSWPDNNYIVSDILGAIPAQTKDLDVLFPALNRVFQYHNFTGVAVVDLANRLMYAKRFKSYPAKGCFPDLQAWIRAQDPDHYDYATSACAALAFLPGPKTEALLNEAVSHPDMLVRMEALYSQYVLGNPIAKTGLLKATLDPVTATTAFSYLEELGLEKEIPPKANDPEYRALCEMVDWLMYPDEYGRPPKSIQLWDKRKLFWPPTDDRRMLYLFRYCYDDPSGKEGEEWGVGLVGSVTFSLYSESEGFKTPEDAYAAHCMWELEWNEDPRAVKGRPIAAGKKLLRFK